MRLDNYINNALQISRNDARQIIKSKKIKVNNTVITKNDYHLKDDDVVLYDDQELIHQEFHYIMMNKPQGYLSVTVDKYQKTIFDLLEGYDVSKLFMVGRLDIDTEGLILITNDGKLCHQLTSPKKECKKKYFVQTDLEFQKEDINTFFEGTIIYETVDKPYKCKKALLEIDKTNNKNAYITITEGKYHQVKKMCKSVGKEVLYLKRVSVGDLTLDDKLKPGEYRELTAEEINILKK